MIQKIAKLKIPKMVSLASTIFFSEKREAISNSFIPYSVDFALSVIRSKARNGVKADTIHTVFSLAKEAPHTAGKTISTDTVSYTHLTLPTTSRV